MFDDLDIFRAKFGKILLKYAPTSSCYIWTANNGRNVFDPLLESCSVLLTFKTDKLLILLV